MDSANQLNTYSYSKIKSFYNCKYGYYKNYIEHNKDRESHGTSEFGSFCHEILEKYEKEELAEYELLDYYIKHYDENVTSTFDLNMSDSFTKNFAELYYESGKEYFREFTGFDNLNVVEAEYDFTELVEDKFYLTGKVDLIARDNDGNLVIVDHKSKSKFKSKAEKAEYAKQLYAYAFAVYRKYGEYPKKMMFNMFRTGTWVEFDFDVDEYKNTINWLVESVKEIESCTEFDADGIWSFYCRNFCAIRNNCPYKM